MYWQASMLARLSLAHLRKHWVSAFTQCRCSQKECRIILLRSITTCTERNPPPQSSNAAEFIYTTLFVLVHLLSLVFHSLQCVGNLAFIANILLKTFSILSSLQALYLPHSQRLDFQIAPSRRLFAGEARFVFCSFFLFSNDNIKHQIEIFHIQDTTSRSPIKSFIFHLLALRRQTDRDRQTDYQRQSRSSVTI